VGARESAAVSHREEHRNQAELGFGINGIAETDIDLAVAPVDVTKSTEFS
jgi:hypothetical protein